MAQKTVPSATICMHGHSSRIKHPKTLLFTFTPRATHCRYSQSTTQSQSGNCADTESSCSQRRSLSPATRLVGNWYRKCAGLCLYPPECRNDCPWTSNCRPAGAELPRRLIFQGKTEASESLLFTKALALCGHLCSRYGRRSTRSQTRDSCRKSYGSGKLCARSWSSRTRWTSSPRHLVIRRISVYGNGGGQKIKSPPSLERASAISSACKETGARKNVYLTVLAGYILR